MLRLRRPAISRFGIEKGRAARPFSFYLQNKEPEMKISPARKAAFDVLLRVERDAAFSSALLPQLEPQLNEKDRGLCHELVLGVLRRKLYLDAFIELLSKGKRID